MLEQLKSLIAGHTEESKGKIILTSKAFVELPKGKGIPKVEGKETRTGAFLVPCSQLFKLVAHLEKQATKAEE